MAIVSLDDLRQHLNITSSDSDAELFGFLEAATELVFDLAGLRPAATYTDVVDFVRGTALLPQPATSVVSVTAAGGGVLSGYLLDRTGYLLRMTSTSRSLTVTVVYVSGRQPADVPARVRAAVLLVAGRLWESQRGNTPSFNAGDEATYTPGMQGIVAEAKALLGPLGVTVGGLA